MEKLLENGHVIQWSVVQEQTNQYFKIGVNGQLVDHVVVQRREVEKLFMYHIMIVVLLVETR